MKKIKNAFTAGQMAYTAFTLLLFPGLILGLSGDPLWPEAWIFTFWFLGLSLVVIAYLIRKDPALLQERLRKPGTGGQENWDKFLVPLVFLLYLAWCALMPLEAKRYHWFTPFPIWVEVLGALGLVPAAFFTYRAYLDNSFVSPLIRVQKERKQKVVSTGVYGFVRHPMYLGGILMMVCAPLLMNSKSALALGAFLSLLICLRILGEEKTLVRGLKGYGAYRRKVKYRLVPGIW